jgi:hypothetical protein
MRHIEALSRWFSDDDYDLRAFIIGQDKAFQAHMAAVINDARVSETAPIGVNSTPYGREPTFIPHGPGDTPQPPEYGNNA